MRIVLLPVDETTRNMNKQLITLPHGRHRQPRFVGRLVSWLMILPLLLSVASCSTDETADDERETSKADVYSPTLKTWMTNRFSSTLTEVISANSAVTIKDLYYRLTTNTIGSHPRLFNQAHFGNLNITTMKEWF